MKLSCMQENLSRGLSVVLRAVASRATLPVTQNVLMTTDGGMLRLASTNLEMSMTTWVGAMVEEEGSITVPARLMSDFVNSLGADRVEMEIEAGSHVLKLRAGRAEASLYGTPASDFPPIPVVEEERVFQVDPRMLRSAIDQVDFAAAREESRPVLTGVNVRLSEGGFTLASADGFRLAVRNGALEQSADEVTVIIPASTMTELGRLLGDNQEPVELMLVPERGQLMFRVHGRDKTELVSQILQGTFPNYDQLIPQEYDTRAVLELPGMLRSTRTASIFARDGSNIVRMQFKPNGSEEEAGGKLVISASSQEVGEFEEELDVIELEMRKDDESKIAFNSRYLVDVLSELSGSRVTLEITSPSSPGVFKPTDSDDYVHVVMPMFVQW